MTLVESPTRVGDRRQIVGWLFYGGGSLVLLALVTGAHRLVLAPHLATQIGHNSEAFAFALALCAMVQFLRPRLIVAGHRLLGAVVPALALVGVGVGLLLMEGRWPPSLVTLNEAFIGVGATWAYAMLPRPLRWGPIVSGVTLAITVVFFSSEVVVDQAESIVPFLIAPLALDVVDRTVLEPWQPDRRVVRLAWVLLLLLVLVAFVVAAPWARADLAGPVPHAIDYGQRAQEAYWGWIFVHLYFGALLPARLRRNGRGVQVGERG